MKQVVFRCTEDTYGMPDPFVPDGTVMILAQDGAAELSRYEAPTPPDDPFPRFDHPVNSAELQGEALKRVLAEHPDIDLHGNALTFVCPPDLAARAVWKQRSSQPYPRGSASPWRA